MPEPSLGEGFLKDIPEQDRNIVGKYVKEWDSGVTKKFEEIHSLYRPFKGMDADLVSKAMYLNDYLQNDPIGFMTQLQDTLTQMKEEGLIEMGDDELEEPEELEEFDENEFSPAALKVIQQLQSQLNDVDTRTQNFLQSQEEKEQLAELDKLMVNLHTEHGEFDDDWVLLQMSRNVAPDEAIKKWNEVIQKGVSSPARRQIPKVMSGNGTIPSGGQVDPSKFNKQDRLAYMTQLLNVAASEA